MAEEIKTLSDLMKQVQKDMELYRQGDPETVRKVEEMDKLHFHGTESNMTITKIKKEKEHGETD